LTGYEVSPAALRSAAGELRTAGGPLYAASTEITAAIGAAVAMNMGYETARALSSFGSAVRQASQRVQQRLDEHVKALQDTAANYEDTDRRSESGFKEFLTV
jgi:uncharacterized protein YukE